ncbi:hypothetical protein NL676_022233 [Syzygium grande]|nr:hypothetical protein NL676_022233 [Syzygium grande]
MDENETARDGVVLRQNPELPLENREKEILFVGVKSTGVSHPIRSRRSLARSLQANFPFPPRVLPSSRHFSTIPCEFPRREELRASRPSSSVGFPAVMDGWSLWGVSKLEPVVLKMSVVCFA